MRVGVVGINHKLADLKLREMLAKACQRRFGPGACIHGHHSFVLLSTCNRTEIYFSSYDLPSTHSYLLSILRNEVDQEFDQKLYSYFGSDCFLHLSRVTAGLDSAIVAETEIQGQVKAAYETSVEYATLPGDIHYLFQKSLKIGKQVRTELPLRRGLPDLEDAILNAGLGMFPTPHETKILFVGASDINLKVIHFLKAKSLNKITLCNRSKGYAQSLAEKYQLNLIDWPLVSNWHHFDWIIFGTKSHEHLITPRQIPDHPISRKLIIDLCVPRNVDPTIGNHCQVTLLNIDQINRSLSIRRQQMNDTLSKAEEIVQDAAKRHTKLFLDKAKVREHLLAVGA